MWPSNYKYDAFISHAVEDKLPIANELCQRLEKENLKIWYSGKELTVGDSLEKTIHKGLDQSRFGVVILSPTYLDKNWTRREFYTLLGKELKEKKVILPVLYNITPVELSGHDITMADRYAVSFDKGMDHVIEKLVKAIRAPQPVNRTKQILFMTLAFGVLFFLFYYLFSSASSAFPEDIRVQLPVSKRMVKFHEPEHLNLNHPYEFGIAPTVVRFNNNNHHIPIDLDADAFPQTNRYILKDLVIDFGDARRNADNTVVSYVYANTHSALSLKEGEISKNEYRITISFENETISENEYPSGPGPPKIFQIKIRGLLSEEE